MWCKPSDLVLFKSPEGEKRASRVPKSEKKLVAAVKLAEEAFSDIYEDPGATTLGKVEEGRC